MAGMIGRKDGLRGKCRAAGWRLFSRPDPEADPGKPADAVDPRERTSISISFLCALVVRHSTHLPNRDPHDPINRLRPPFHILLSLRSQTYHPHPPLPRYLPTHPLENPHIPIPKGMMQQLPPAPHGLGRRQADEMQARDPLGLHPADRVQGRGFSYSVGRDEHREGLLYTGVAVCCVACS